MKTANITGYQPGFTLVELMIVVAIIGILAGVGYPIYSNAVVKGEREDGIRSLLRQASTMEEHYLNNDTYVGAPLTSATSERGNYNMSIDQATAFAYTITATRNPAAADPDCTSLSLDNLGQKTATGGDTGECWPD